MVSETSDSRMALDVISACPALFPCKIRSASATAWAWLKTLNELKYDSSGSSGSGHRGAYGDHARATSSTLHLHLIFTMGPKMIAHNFYYLGIIFPFTQDICYTGFSGKSYLCNSGAFIGTFCERTNYTR